MRLFCQIPSIDIALISLLKSCMEYRCNDRADELVQWGKEEGPYARLRALGEGEGESRFGAADRSRGSETRDEGLGSGVLHRGR
eukprot:COSAG05_NODE_248_length_12946_cov_85.003737_4_plen_84_part_00